MENLFFLALVAVIGLIRWLMQSAEQKKNEQAAQGGAAAPSAPIPRAPAQTEEERIRRFMEALGVPKGELAPRRMTPRAPKRILPVDPFPVPRSAAGLPPVIVSTAAEPIAPQPAPVIRPQPSAAPAAIRLQDDPPTVTNMTTTLADRLATPEGLRDAIVLREIFGPPRSMQPLELTRVL